MGRGRLGGGAESCREARSRRLALVKGSPSGTDRRGRRDAAVSGTCGKFWHQLFSFYTHKKSLSAGNAGVETRVMWVRLVGPWALARNVTRSGACLHEELLAWDFKTQAAFRKTPRRHRGTPAAGYRKPSPEAAGVKGATRQTPRSNTNNHGFIGTAMSTSRSIPPTHAQNVMGVVHQPGSQGLIHQSMAAPLPCPRPSHLAVSCFPPLQSMFAWPPSITDSIRLPDRLPCRPLYAFLRLPAPSLAASPLSSWSTLVRRYHSQSSVAQQSRIQERRSSSEALVFLRAVPSPAIPPWWVAASMLPTR